MKFLLYLTIFLYILTSSSCAQDKKELIQGNWIAVKSRQVGKDWISPMEGFMLSLQKDSGQITFIGSKSIKDISYKVVSDSIISNDTTNLGYIKFVSKDSMVLLIGKNMEAVFHPVKNTNINLSTESIESLLTNNSWKLTNHPFNERIGFFNENWYEEDDNFKVGITYSKRMFVENERWTISKYKNEYMMIISFGQLEFYPYQILSITNQKIELDLLKDGNDKPVVLEVIKPLSEDKYLGLNSIVSSKKWSISTLKSTESGESIEIKNKNDGFGASLSADSMILESDFVNKKISFMFVKNHSYSIDKEDASIRSGKWSISTDGQFLILDYPAGANSYIEIIDAKESHLTLRIAMKFQREKGNNEYVHHDCIIRLE